MIIVKNRELTLGGQFEAYKRGQLERNIQPDGNPLGRKDEMGRS